VPQRQSYDIPSPETQSTGSCHLCGNGPLELAPAFEEFQRVTSDCKPWQPGGTLARCKTCGLVQVRVDDQWHADAERIYREYQIYHQADGAEQHVFHDADGRGKPRSQQLIRALKQKVGLPATGRLLDVGCGNGAFLSAWSCAVPGWQLVGSEVSDKHRAQVESIPGVERLHTKPLSQLQGSFDVITLVHVLEHIPGPCGLLDELAKRLHRGGIVIVEVPDCAQNPYMLVVADHCSHFSPELLRGLFLGAGWIVEHATNTWVAKEVSLIARPPQVGLQPPGPRLSPAESDLVFSGSRMLREVRARARELSTRRSFGLFGTAIAATWVDAETERRARFFVDEDIHRIGRTHLDRPIVAPAQVPPGSTVLVPLPLAVATPVAARLRSACLDVEIVVA
jgi:SAM-dependent methyltransferase